ncbi:MAG: hypothetical protein U9R21_06395 [Candidatus Thermoplasmatota archaeon]|nr:hypothetical protein [Candidatus Thermoplasmatota archaeon]
MRPIKITQQEIVDSIRKFKVIKIKRLVDDLDCSNWTLFNKLKGLYYTSYNFKGQYITLKDIPIFDENGIWEYRQARFSNWGTVEEIICHIVDRSAAGISAGEIAGILQIRTHNQLLKCRRKELLVSMQYGRNQVYYSPDEKTRRHQMEAREAMVRESLKQKTLSNKTIIDVLLVMVKHNETKPENIVHILTSMGKRMSIGDVTRVINEYGIKKNSCEL